jgi:hypothetical protein
MNNLPTTNKTKQILIAVIVGIMVIILAILTIIVLNVNLFVNILIFWSLATFYALFAFFLVDAPVIQINPERIVEKPVYRDVIQIVEKPVYRDVIKEVEKPIQIPIENKTIEVVEKPIYIETPVIKRIYIEKPRQMLNIPRYKFIGSTQTKTYHKRNCKFAKMLKRKYKLHSNNKAFFKRKHYKACKTCMKR